MSYLDDLLDGARARVADARASVPEDELRERAGAGPAPPDLVQALSGPGVAVIAEIKRASPSRGPLAPELDPVAHATAYREGGAAAVSVLTEPDRFGGSLEDLTAVSELGVPTLRKDFIIDPYQVWEARAAGAAAVLLIVAALDDAELERLLSTCDETGLDALVEVHDASEARRAVGSGAGLIGVNARDLRTFEVDRDAFSRVRPELPDDAVTVAESGIRGPEDVAAAMRSGADAVLVGESVVTADDPASVVAMLVSAGSAPLTATEYR